MRIQRRMIGSRLKRGSAAAIALATVALSVTACSAADTSKTKSDPASEAVSLSIAEQGTAGATTGLYPHLADELGFFADENITIDEYVVVKAGSEAVAGMVSGSVQISHIGPEGITASSKGADVIGIAAAMDASIWAVVGNANIKDWPDLRGQTIALGSLSDITRVVFDGLAEAANLDPETDFTYVALGATPQRIAAVQNGQAAATLASYPSVADVASKGKMNILGLAPKGAKPPSIIASDIEASGSWAKANPEVVTRYLRAIIRTVEYVRDPANEAELAPMISKLTGASEEAASAMLDAYFYNPPVEGVYFPADFHHPEGVFDATVKAYRTLGFIDKAISEDDYMDYSFVDAALQ